MAAGAAGPHRGDTRKRATTGRLAPFIAGYPDRPPLRPKQSLPMPPLASQIGTRLRGIYPDLVEFPADYVGCWASARPVAKRSRRGASSAGTRRRVAPQSFGVRPLIGRPFRLTRRMVGMLVSEDLLPVRRAIRLFSHRQSERRGIRATLDGTFDLKPSAHGESLATLCPCSSALRRRDETLTIRRVRPDRSYTRRSGCTIRCPKLKTIANTKH